MEREEKKLMQKSSPVQMAKVMGNQAVVQGMFGGHTLRPRKPSSASPDSDSDSDTEKDDYRRDSSYRQKKAQYLSSSDLRKELGGKTGGEAHHIIPSCVAEAYNLNANTCNKAWNGILLPGAPGENPLEVPETKPYHRYAGVRDHANYSYRVRLRLGQAPNIANAQAIAGVIRPLIEGYGAGRFIDDMTNI